MQRSYKYYHLKCVQGLLSREVNTEVHHGKCGGGAVPAQPAMMYFIKAAEREKQSAVSFMSKKQRHLQSGLNCTLCTHQSLLLIKEVKSRMKTQLGIKSISLNVWS